MPVHASILELVGGTPLVRLVPPAGDAAAGVLGKLERCNPMGSVKDRIAVAMLDDAEARGRLRPGGTVVEPTSGNTGIGLAMVCAVKRYRLVLTMPESMSVERRQILHALGAHVVLTSGAEGMGGAIYEAERIAATMTDAFRPCQFDNPANPAAHERTTGPEIWEATGGQVDVLVAGIGTGGTITGVGRYLKRRKGALRVIGVEPAESPFLSEGRSGPHPIQGIGAGFCPKVLDLSVVDGIETVETGEATAAARHAAVSCGVFCGISSGAALAVAWRIARRDTRQRTIVVVLPDGGERDLSTKLWRPDGMP